MLKLCSTFWIFGYDLRVYVNLTAEQMEQTTQTLAQETENDVSIFKGYASLVVCILSHGGPGEVYGIDGQPVMEASIRQTFQGVVELRDKLQLFIIQACRGDSGYVGREMTGMEEGMSIDYSTIH